jgi:hypothetical protein
MYAYCSDPLATGTRAELSVLEYVDQHFTEINDVLPPKQETCAL